MVFMILLLLVLTTGYMFWPRSPVDLSRGDAMDSAGLYARWSAGDVIVVVRHAERCDRSSNQCLGPADGITQYGSRVSADVGSSLGALGLEQTDVITSPATRTAQTAFYMFGHAVQTQDWLYDCEKFDMNQIAAHKTSHHNLVLVTHSGCIGQLEKQQGYPHSDMSEYDSALFIAPDAQGHLRILGKLNPESWKQIAKR
ncbi:histidine phosphatase family protein [Pseudomonas sp. NPDC090202]|uniref:lipopolysaccharide core heptose(II)-phosphate phosphatase PmrG n=1 Tax=unclassified Pseudomonas TaxID=196821 RepID=UPI00380367D9